MAKRPKFSRWRRLPGAYRFGDQKVPDPNQELQRLTLYVPGSALDLAESQAARQGFANAQDYCTDLVLQALECRLVSEQVEQVETKRGPLEGLHAIADDPEYLADLRAAASDPHTPTPAPSRPAPSEIRWVEPAAHVPAPPSVMADPPAAGVSDAPAPPLGTAAWVILRHAAQAEHDPLAFLPSLRRGESVAPSEVAELAQALHELEIECRRAGSLDRRLAFALHRLAFESQILHTDAWPDAFDVWTVEMLRAVQEAVERILSGQDIRYYPAAHDQGLNAPPRPELPR